jgi:hypothetical protein
MSWPAARENPAPAGLNEASCKFFRRKKKNNRANFPNPVVGARQRNPLSDSGIAWLQHRASAAGDSQAGVASRYRS